MSPDSKDGNEIARSNTLPTSDASERKTMAFHAYPHAEKHTEHGPVVRDTIIGFADGLTVPFALTAGVSRLVPSNLSLNISSLAKYVKFIGTLAYDPLSIGSSRLVIVGGLAELFAGAISMGLGGYLAAVTERKHYEVEEAREAREVEEEPEAEEDEIYEIFAAYNMSRATILPVVESLKADKEMWVKVCCFVFNFHPHLHHCQTHRHLFFIEAYFPLFPWLSSNSGIT